jgi:hypothetical protein
MVIFFVFVFGAGCLEPNGLPEETDFARFCR